MTTGEGGIILTDDDKLATALRHCRAYDFDDTRHFWHKRLAWNLRMSSLEAALGRAQLERLDELIAARQRNYAYYCERLGDLVEFLAQKSYATSVSWMCGLLTRDLEERDGLMAFLERNQIETRTFFFPMHQQPVYKSREAFPVAEDLSRRGLYLPSSSHLTEEQLDSVVRSVRAYLEPRRRTGL
jgi:perosamine synthetase